MERKVDDKCDIEEREREREREVIEKVISRGRKSAKRR
jgi:hypothetical protein